MSAGGQEPGRIVTFYSYKGGTGRSQAVANVAWILASNGQRVLVIDWDLEAPGVHRYFHPFIADEGLGASQGVIDFLATFVEKAYKPRDAADERWFERCVDLEPYSFSLDWEFPNGGTLDFVPAGQQGPAYPLRVTSFDWRAFYEKLGGGVFLQAVRARLRGEYDWILIDSRTGISDASGICTVHMPDDLVVCFTLNDQSIRGASTVAESASEQRRKPDGEPGVRVFPLCTRVERAEHERLQLAKQNAARAFDPYVSRLRPELRDGYWGRMEVGYIPFYAYEEVLAVFGDLPGQTGSMLTAMETLCEFISDGRVTRLAEMDESVRTAQLARYLRHVPVEQVATEKAKGAVPTITSKGDASSEKRAGSKTGLHVGPAQGPTPRASASAWRPREANWKYWFYVSYARPASDRYLERFVADLEERVSMRVGAVSEQLSFFDRRTLSTVDEFARQSEDALATSRVCVALYSPHYFASEFCGREFTVFRRRNSEAKPFESSGIIPIVWIPARAPPAVWDIQISGRGVSVERGVQHMMRLRRNFGLEYEQLLDELATAIVDIGTKSPLRIVELPDFSTIPNTFGPADGPVSGMPGLVRLVHLVGTRDELVEVKGHVGAYGAGGLDWSPLEGRPAHVLLQSVLARHELLSDELAVSDAVLDEAREASGRGQHVLFVIDPWSLRLEPYRSLAAKLDEYLDPNWAVIFLVDPEDPDTVSSRFELEKDVEDVFPRRSGAISLFTSMLGAESSLERRIAELRVSWALRRAAARDFVPLTAVPVITGSSSGNA